MLLFLCCALPAMQACGDDDTSDAGAGTGAGGAGGKTSSGGTGGSSSIACEAVSGDVERVVCAAQAFVATLSESEAATVQLEFSDSNSRTLWSNLPGQTRAGIKMGSLSATAQAAALALMQTVLSEGGITDLTGVRAAGDVLGSQSGSGMMGGGGG